MPELLPDLTFGAFLQYSPRGVSEISRLSRTYRDAVKQYHPDKVAAAVDELARTFDASPLPNVLTPGCTLIPAPRSAPQVKGALWPGHMLSRELVAKGIGSAVVPLIRRRTAVVKSAFAAPENRPTARTHLDSIEFAEGDLFAPSSTLIVVDDFITRGATLLACASLLAARYPAATIGAFAFIRTMSSGEVPSIFAPVVGTIRLTDGHTFRFP